MAAVIRMPEVLTGMAEAVLLSWHVSPGEDVSVGQPIAEIETEKAVVDYEAEQAGTVAGFLVAIGTPISVGTPILVLATAGESTEQAMAHASAEGSAAAPDTRSAAANENASVPQHAEAPKVQQLASAQHHPVEPPAPRETGAPEPNRFASPLVRRLAREHQVDLATITGTGPGGRIVRRDLDRHRSNGADQPGTLSSAAVATESVPPPAAETPAAETDRSASSGPRQPAAALRTPKPAPRADNGGYTDVPHSGMRRAIARRLAESKQTVPHFYLVADCHVDALLELRATMKAESATSATPSSAPSVNDFVVKAVGGAFQDVPEANVIWMPDAVRRFDSVSVAVAVALDDGLVTPVVRDVDKRSISDISRTIVGLAGLAREGRLNQSDLEGGVFTVSNLGMYGIERFAAIINPPHAGILAVGAATKRVVVDDNGDFAVATMMTVTLSGDHRALDGALAARWLRAFQERIEHPMRILL